MPMTTAVHNGPKVAQLHNARDPRVVSKEDHIVGKEGGCRLIQKEGDFKTINVVSKFIPKG